MAGKLQPIKMQLLCHMTIVFPPLSRPTSRSEFAGRSEMKQVDQGAWKARLLQH